MAGANRASEIRRFEFAVAVRNPYGFDVLIQAACAAPGVFFFILSFFLAAQPELDSDAMELQLSSIEIGHSSD